jgi:hypothetical protein
MAAGQGFKTFTSGEVLTAADVNGYLMQGVGVFTDAANRDAEITSPQEGQFAFLKDTNVTTYYTGSAWANLDTTGMTNPMTTTGDTIYSSSGSTPARLGIGSTGNVLTVAGGVPTWATPAGGAKSYSLLNAGGTALTGAATITVSGISGVDNLMIIVDDASSASASTLMTIQFNTDSSTKYIYSGIQEEKGSAFTIVSANPTGDTSIFFGVQGNNSGNEVCGYIQVFGANGTGSKAFQLQSAGSGTGAYATNTGGVYTGTSTISSVSIISGTGNFDAGTIYIYGA